MSNYLSDHELRYLHCFAQCHDERKCLSKIFGAYTPRKRHDEIMRKPMAMKEFKKIVDNAVKEMELSSSASLKKLMNIQNATLADFVDLRTGVIKDDIEPEYLDAIKSIKYDPETGAVVQIQLNDKLKAIETSLKFTGMLTKKIDVNVNLSISEQLASSAIGDEEVDVFIKNLLSKPDDKDVIEVDAMEAQNE